MLKIEDLTMALNKGFLNIRVACWHCKNNRLLISKFPSGRYSLIGGRVQFGESLTEAIIREVAEESNLSLIEPTLIAVIENFFDSEGSFFHELLFIFKGDLAVDDNFYYSTPGEQLITWLPTSKINQVQPRILEQLLHLKPSDPIAHLIERDASLN